MSEKDQSPASGFNRDLLGILDLKPQKLEPMTFGQFLSELKEHPERADTAHALLVRAVESMGEVDIDTQPRERQPRLRMLKELNYKLYNAFDMVRGSQRITHFQMEHLRAAASKGYQLFLALIIKGPPGSGKSMLVDAFKAALEGQVVYSVEGCPVHENPLNLLTLLSKKSQKALAKRLGLTDEEAKANGTPSLSNLLAAAGVPCRHCWAKVLENKEFPDPNEALLNIKVVPERLSARRFGISTMTPNCSLATTIARGNRGVADLGELFDGAALSKGSGFHPQLKPLLDATNDCKLLGGLAFARGATPARDGSFKQEGPCDVGGENPGTDEVPLDVVIIGQTNSGAYDKFIESLDKDAGKATRRFHVFSFPYNTSVTDEELAYKDQLGRLMKVPHFDPMALKLLALLAVISRLDVKGEVDVVSRARIYDGEKLQVKRKSASSKTFTESFPVGGSASATADHPDYWSVKDLWEQAGKTEAMFGVDMTVMFLLLSEIVERGLNEKRHEGCVSSYEMISFLRERIITMEKSDGFTTEQKEALKLCRERFLAVAKKGDESKAEIEREYQRLLRRQVYEIAAPDFERRAEETFKRYRDHAQARASGQATVHEKDDAGRRREVEVDTAFLLKVEAWMSLNNDAERDSFRRSLEGEILKFTRERRQRHRLCADDGECDDVDINWRTLPKLADGIRRMLNDETRARLEKVLKQPMELPNELEEDKKLREQLVGKFDELGYCKHCRSQALEYFKLNELWSAQS